MPHLRINSAARVLGAALLTAALAACTSTAPVGAGAAPAPSSGSVQQADRNLALVASERAAVTATYAASEQRCYEKFFVNRCLDAARETRRVALARLHEIEIEAEYFKRKASVEERDRELARAEKEFAESEARAAAQPAKPEPEPERAPRKPGKPVDREAEHKARMARIEAREKAEAPQRAAKARAFEERKLKSEQRQREIADKLKNKQ